ncbi:MAG: hypothetical protein AAGG48_16640 [Planctomycetota bacterium]
MVDSSNPYTTPTAESERHSHLDFAPILFRWEKLRIGYNVVLVLGVLAVTLLGFPRNLLLPEYWMSVAFGGLLANVFFFLGPAFEAYGTYFKFWNSTLTVLLFLAGLGLTALLALISIATF